MKVIKNSNMKSTAPGSGVKGIDSKTFLSVVNGIVYQLVEEC